MSIVPKTKQKYSNIELQLKHDYEKDPLMFVWLSRNEIAKQYNIPSSNLNRYLNAVFCKNYSEIKREIIKNYVVEHILYMSTNDIANELGYSHKEKLNNFVCYSIGYSLKELKLIASKVYRTMKDNSLEKTIKQESKRFLESDDKIEFIVNNNYICALYKSKELQKRLKIKRKTFANILKKHNTTYSKILKQNQKHILFNHIDEYAFVVDMSKIMGISRKRLYELIKEFKINEEYKTNKIKQQIKKMETLLCEIRYNTKKQN